MRQLPGLMNLMNLMNFHINRSNRSPKTDFLPRPPQTGQPDCSLPTENDARVSSNIIDRTFQNPTVSPKNGMTWQKLPHLGILSPKARQSVHQRPRTSHGKARLRTIAALHAVTKPAHKAGISHAHGSVGPSSPTNAPLSVQM